MTTEVPPYPTKDLHAWALEVVDYLRSNTQSEEVTAQVIFLQHRRGAEKAFTDGIMMFDPTLGEPVYTNNGSWWKLDGTPA